MLEIIQHDGPARRGKFNGILSPGIIQSDNPFKLTKDEPVPYDVPKALAEWSVKKTVQYAKEDSEKGIVTIHGSKYLDLRIKCAKELEALGNNIFLIANSDKLIKRQKDLIEIIVTLRETLNPNSALYIPFTDLSFIPLLTYLGVDFFGSYVCDFYAKLNTIVTPTSKYDLNVYPIYDLNYEEIRKYNYNTLDFVIKEIRENIKNGTLRNLVEMRCCSSPETMSALRILDQEYQEFLNKYTPLY
ncbi:MAG: archaeosine tRNA-ribosyltransferase [Methanobacteriaceae archaeon]|nr:archaeosine tRNA-ribosyltransferase [Methanobacteriaceae archaeon]